jgi:hypothetical protein
MDHNVDPTSEVGTNCRSGQRYAPASIAPDIPPPGANLAATRIGAPLRDRRVATQSTIPRAADLRRNRLSARIPSARPRP